VLEKDIDSNASPSGTGGEDASRPDLVLFVSYAYPPCPDPGATRPGHFAKYLRRFGYNVKVISSFEPNSSADEVIYVLNRRRVSDRKSVAGLMEMVLRKFFFASDESMLWAVDAFKAGAPLIREYPNAAVFSTFPPLNSHLAAWRLKRKYGVRWIADFRDPMVGSPGRALANSRQRFGAIPTEVDKRLQRAMFRDADILIANTDTVLRQWKERYPAFAGKMVHIWNGFDAEQRTTAAHLPARDFKVIAHVGSIYTGRHPGPLLESIDRLTTNGRLDPKSFSVQLVGHLTWSSLPNAALFQKFSAMGCLNATGRSIPQADAVQVMREADYLLLLDVLIEGSGQQIPSKIFDYVTIGRPILAITTRNSPADRVLARSGIPYACIYADSTADEADRAVLDLLSMSTEPSKPSAWFLENFDAVPRTRALASLIESTGLPEPY